MSEQQQINADAKRIEDAAALLAEHFDSVNIFVTRHDSEEGQTVQLHIGRGNCHAGYGWIKQYLLDFEEITKMMAQKRFKRDYDED